MCTYKGTTDPDNTSNTPGIVTNDGQVLDQKLVNSYAAQVHKYTHIYTYLYTNIYVYIYI
jgi:hypothetical protein